MRKVILNMNEEKKYITIKKLVETHGNKRSAAIKLDCSLRTVNRLIKTYNDHGKSGFVHGNRNRKPTTTFDPFVKKQIIDFYNNTYYDFNFTHFTEFLQLNHNINVSNRSVLNWLAEEDIISPKAWRQLKLTLKRKLKTANKKETIVLNNKITILDYPDIHPRKTRSAYFGELIQMDASDHLWFGDTKAQLHAAIDDATGIIVGAYFAPQETLNGYYNVLFQILNGYGIPARFFTDKLTIFEYKKAPFTNEDTFTQFAYACHQLGTEILTSSVPQAKGCIERLFQTLQSRLIPELRLAGVKTIEKANTFLAYYIQRYNCKFSLHIDSNKSVFDEQPTPARINEILSVINERLIDSGHSIKYKNRFYLPVDKKGTVAHYRNKTKCLVIESFDGTLYMNINDTMYRAEEIITCLDKSPEFDEVVDKKPKIKNIPALTHPWRHGSFENFALKQKHHNGANV